MKFFTIDENKCTRCNLCAEDCPTQIIQPATKQHLPVEVAGAIDGCIDCGHCVAVCPTGAFALSSMSCSECDKIDKKNIIDEMQMGQLLKSRRSVRRFKDKPISHDELAGLIEVARYAPTGSNKQQVQWTIFEEADKVNHLASLVVDWCKSLAGISSDPKMAAMMERLGSAWDKGQDPILRGAPHLIVVHAHENVPSAAADCAIALTYLELYAASKGFGTCWAGFLQAAANNYSPLLEALDLPEGHKCHGAVMIGYPQFQYKLIPKRKKSQIRWR